MPARNGNKGFATQSFNRERGSSYLTMIAGVGFLGAMPIPCCCFASSGASWLACKRIRLSNVITDASVPMAAVVTASLCHAVFEDWLFATGNYLSILFWIFAFALARRETAVHA